MPRKLRIAALVLALSGCKSIDVAPAVVTRSVCPEVAPSLPCDATPASPATLAELRAAWLRAQLNAENCKALAEEWQRRYGECVK